MPPMLPIALVYSTKNPIHNTVRLHAKYTRTCRAITLIRIYLLQYSIREDPRWGSQPGSSKDQGETRKGGGWRGEGRCSLYRDDR